MIIVVDFLKIIDTSEMTTFKCIHQTDLSNEIVNLAYRLLKLCNSANRGLKGGLCR